jgi:hypothetical protein
VVWVRLPIEQTHPGQQSRRQVVCLPEMLKCHLLRHDGRIWCLPVVRGGWGLSSGRSLTQTRRRRYDLHPSDQLDRPI